MPNECLSVQLFYPNPVTIPRDVVNDLSAVLYIPETWDMIYGTSWPRLGQPDGYMSPRPGKKLLREFHRFRTTPKAVQRRQIVPLSSLKFTNQREGGARTAARRSQSQQRLPKGWSRLVHSLWPSVLHLKEYIRGQTLRSPLIPTSSQLLRVCFYP